MKKYLGLFCLWFFASSAFATIAQVTQYQSNGSGTVSSWFSTRVASCQDWAVKNQALHPSSQTAYVSTDSVSPFYCRYSYYSYGTVQAYVGTATQSACPTNSTLSGAVCVCNSGYSDVIGVCTSIASSAQTVVDGLNFTTSVMYAPVAGGSTSEFCYAGYTVKSSGSATPVKDGVTGNTEYFGPYTSGGTVCAGAAASSTAPAIACLSGQFSGTVNGVAVCSPASSMNMMQAGPSVTAATPSGSASAPVSAIAGAPPTATGSSQSTACVGGQCTTTTTFTGSGGTVVGSKSESKPVASFCAENPGSVICSDGKAVNTAPGAVPTSGQLYTRKYPDGFAGVWATQSAAIKASPLVGLTGSLHPTISGTGGYPSFVIPMNMLMIHGTYDVSPPGYVWDFLKVCVIISALFLCRALIFGG